MRRTLAITVGALAAALPSGAQAKHLTMHQARTAVSHALSADARNITVRCHRRTSRKIRCRLSADMPELFITAAASSDTIGGDVTVGPDYARSSYTVFATLHRSGRITLWSPFWGWLPG